MCVIEGIRALTDNAINKTSPEPKHHTVTGLPEPDMSRNTRSPVTKAWFRSTVTTREAKRNHQAHQDQAQKSGTASFRIRGDGINTTNDHMSITKAGGTLGNHVASSQRPRHRHANDEFARCCLWRGTWSRNNDRMDCRRARTVMPEEVHSDARRRTLRAPG
ncbi:hypothetical protein EI94DRAFT_1235819 [Lactarius quietus]|nr:hypothetical protein EI94DRAFT_1235819 [Lactarius quietus]